MISINNLIIEEKKKKGKGERKTQKQTRRVIIYRRDGWKIDINQIKKIKNYGKNKNENTYNDTSLLP